MIKLNSTEDAMLNFYLTFDLLKVGVSIKISIRQHIYMRSLINLCLKLDFDVWSQFTCSGGKSNNWWEHVLLTTRWRCVSSQQVNFGPLSGWLHKQMVSGGRPVFSKNRKMDNHTPLYVFSIMCASVIVQMLHASLLLWPADLNGFVPGSNASGCQACDSTPIKAYTFRSIQL